MINELIAKVVDGFTTCRYVFDENSGQMLKRGVTSNIGIHAFIVESLLNSGMVDNQLDHFLIAIDNVIEEAIKIKGKHYWRWEKSPMRSDYHYPPDWDDTAKALDCLHAFVNARNRVGIETPKLQPILSGPYWPSLKKSIFKSFNVGFRCRIQVSTPLAIYIFLGGRKKHNNAEDPMVSVNCLRMFAKHRRKEFFDDIFIFQALAERLLEIAEVGLNNRIPFSEISKCYFSWGHYILRLYELVEESLPEMHYRMENIVGQYFDCFSKGFVKLEDSLEHEYANWLVSEGGFPSYISQKDKVFYYPKKLGILYQHRRLNHLYGSYDWYQNVMSFSRRGDLNFVKSKALVGITESW